MADTTLPGLFATGIHSARPAASAVGKGGLYSCTTHSLVYQTDGSSWTTWASLTGTGLSDPMTTRGDSIYRDASNVTARLAIPAAGQVLGRSGSDLGAVYPPGYELGYAAITSTVTSTNTSPGDIAGLSVTFTADGTAVWVEVFTPTLASTSGSDGRAVLEIYDTTGSAVKQQWVSTANAGGNGNGANPKVKLTPSAGSQSYKARMWTPAAGTVSVAAFAVAPSFIRVTKA